MDKKMFGMGAVMAVAGAGIVYYFMASKDHTPVGLVVINREHTGELYEDDDDYYTYEVIQGTWRETENSLPLKPLGDNEALLVVFKQDESTPTEPIYAEIVNPNDWNRDCGEDCAGDWDKMNAAQLAFNENMRDLLKTLNLDTSKVDEKIEFLENAANGEQNSGSDVQNAEFALTDHIMFNSVQSNHWW